MGFRVQYGDLLKGFNELPVFRTTSEDRMVDSAYVPPCTRRFCILTNCFLRLNFAAGFFDVRTYQTDYNQLIMIESSGFNNTLAPNEACPNANNAIGGQGSVFAEDWITIYLESATKRLAPMITGVNLTTTDLYNMQLACAYEVN